jgi:hypothetical protein
VPRVVHGGGCIDRARRGVSGVSLTRSPALRVPGSQWANASESVGQRPSTLTSRCSHRVVHVGWVGSHDRWPSAPLAASISTGFRGASRGHTSRHLL